MEEISERFEKGGSRVFDQLFEKVRLHVEAGANASRPWPFDTILISMLLEQERQLDELRSEIKAYEESEEGTTRNQGEPSTR